MKHRLWRTLFCVCFFVCFGSKPIFATVQGLPPPEAFSAVMFDEDGANERGLRASSDYSSSSLNPVFHWNNLASEDLREGVGRTLTLTSRHPMRFLLSEIKIVEKPENLDVSISPDFLSGNVLSGIFLSRSQPLSFRVEVKSSGDVLPQNYRVRA